MRELESEDGEGDGDDALSEGWESWRVWYLLMLVIGTGDVMCHHQVRNGHHYRAHGDDGCDG